MGGLIDNILRQADKGAAGAPLLSGAESVGDNFRQRVGGGHFNGIFGHRTEHRHGIHALMDQFCLIRPLNRATQRHHRIALAVRGSHPGNQIRTAWAGGDQRDARFTGQATDCRGHKGGISFVAHGNNPDGGVQQRIEDFIYFRAGDAEDLADALGLKLTDYHIRAVRPLAFVTLIVHMKLLSFLPREWRRRDCQDANRPGEKRCRPGGQSAVCGSRRKSARRYRAGNPADGRRPDDRR